MYIFQVNPNQIKEGNEIKSKDWLFWNAYLKDRVKSDDYVLLPDYIDFIADTNGSLNDQQFLVTLDDDDYTE